MSCKAPEPLFQIGDEVETTEEYKQETEKWNRILDREAESYKHGKVTGIQVVTDYKPTSNLSDGMYWQGYTSEVVNIWICVTLDDDPGKLVNQIYLQKVTP